MKTIKFLSFFSLILLLSSCNALADLASKTIEVVAPAINFSIGGPAAAPQQKVAGATSPEVIWLDNKQVDITTSITDKLSETGLKLSNVKSLDITASKIHLTTPITQTYILGDIKIYVNNVVIAQSTGASLSPTQSDINFTYTQPYSLFNFLSAGTVLIKITSTAAKPNIILNMQLLNTYSTKISLF